LSTLDAPELVLSLAAPAAVVSSPLGVTRPPDVVLAESNVSLVSAVVVVLSALVEAADVNRQLTPEQLESPPVVVGVVGGTLLLLPGLVVIWLVCVVV
jgi:hypothetical protein